MSELRVPAAPAAGEARVNDEPRRLPTVTSLRHRRREKLGEAVAYEIVEGLVAGRFTPGEMLPPEAAMLEQYGVSRPTMREALRILEVQGVVVMRPGQSGGPVYVGPSGEYLGRMASLHFHLRGASAADLLAARLLVEPAMARMAAERQDPDAMAMLHAFVSGDPDPEANDAAYINQAPDFHMMLAQASGNGVLELMAEAMRHIANSVAMNARWGGFGLPAEISKDVHDSHHEIAWAIINGEGERAAELTSTHDNQVVDWFVERDAQYKQRTVPWVR